MKLTKLDSSGDAKLSSKTLTLTVKVPESKRKRKFIRYENMLVANVNNNMLRSNMSKKKTLLLLMITNKNHEVIILAFSKYVKRGIVS